MTSPSLQTEVKVGIFVTFGTILTMFAILTLGSTENLFTRSNTYVAHFKSVEGLIRGAKVVLGGIQVGIVKETDFDKVTKDIVVEIEVDTKYAEWIRQGSGIEILTQGMLGDKYISISAGPPSEPILPNKSELPVRPTKDIAQFISKGDQLMNSLTSIAVNLDHLLKTFDTKNRPEMIFENLASTTKNLSAATGKLSQEFDNLKLKSSMQRLDSILTKIDNGTGTLGALVNDPTLYYDTRSLMGGANRNRVMRNLVRKTVQDGEETSVEDKK